MAMPSKAQFVTGWFLPVDTGAHPEHPIELPDGGDGEQPQPPGIWGPTDPRPTPPIVIPPLVGIWPSPGRPVHPIVIPKPEGPVYIEGTPEKPIQSAPGTLSPPLPAGAVPNGKVALLVEVVGVPGKRWLTFDNSLMVNPLPGNQPQQHR